MKFTKLARKKLSLILSGEREASESEFLRCYIVDALPTLDWKHGLSRNEVREYCRRCDMFGVEVLGIELYPDSPFPIHTFIQEDYIKDNYEWNWIEIPLHELEALGIDSFIIPVVHVPEDVLEEYMKE